MEASLTQEESLTSIRKLLEDVCGSLNPVELPTNNKGLETALQEILQRLPPLLRVRVEAEVPDSLPLEQLASSKESTSARQVVKRWSLHTLEPRSKRLEMERALAARYKRMGWPASELWKGSQRGSEGDEEVICWTECEEVAWCCYCWRLMSSMSEQLKRRHFLRAWLRASHETQKLRFEAALETISERLKRAVPCTKSAGTRHKGSFVPLFPHIRSLQRLWLRKALWQEQRQGERVRLEFPGSMCDVNAAEKSKQIRAMAIFVSERLKDVGIVFPQEYLARKEPLWKKGQWISQRLEGVIRNGRIWERSSKANHYVVQWSDVEEQTTVPESKLKPSHFWRSGEAVEVFDERGLSRPAVVAQHFEKVAKMKVSTLFVRLH
eukprot:symbB.v1.2.027611.t1/scaffold2844.1/size70809/2